MGIALPAGKRDPATERGTGTARRERPLAVTGIRPKGPGVSSRSRGIGRAAALVLAAALLAAGGLLLRNGTGRERPVRPDIVLVVWDTCRGDRVSVNGYGKPTTPVLAAFAGDATTFRCCFTPSPWTPPAHASLFTGLLPVHHRLREGPGDTLAPGIPLLAETLRNEGYETVAVSANPLLTLSGLLRGFELTVSVVHPGEPKGYGGEVVEAVEDWLRRRDDRPAQERRPFFLFVNLMECHQPLFPGSGAWRATHGEGSRAPAEGVHLYGETGLAHTLGIRRLGAEALRSLSLGYDAAVAEADAATGRIFDRLRGRDLLDGAVVVVTADHGESLGEHGELEHRLSMHAGVLHVPLVVRWPGVLDGGRSTDAQVRLQDLHPTLLEAAGVPVPPACAGDARSLSERPLRPRAAVSQIHWVTALLPPLRARFPGVPEETFDRFHLSTLVHREAAEGPSERTLHLRRRFVPPAEVVLEDLRLYDTRRDPGEERNLLAPGGRKEDREAAERTAASLAHLLD